MFFLSFDINNTLLHIFTTVNFSLVSDKWTSVILNADLGSSSDHPLQSSELRWSCGPSLPKLVGPPDSSMWWSGGLLENIRPIF